MVIICRLHYPVHTATPGRREGGWWELLLQAGWLYNRKFPPNQTKSTLLTVLYMYGVSYKLKREKKRNNQHSCYSDEAVLLLSISVQSKIKVCCYKSQCSF